MLLVALSTLLSLLLAEATLRVLAVTPDRYLHTRSLETADKRLALDLYPDDPEGAFPVDLTDEAVRAGYRARGLAEVDEHYERTPHGVELTYSEELCRGGPIEPKAPGTARVMFIGDSFTEGQGVVEADTAVAVLDERLGANVEVLNCARRGYDFPELHSWLDTHLALEPDVVVYAMVLNDPEQSAAFHARQAYIDDWIVDRRRMIERGDGSPPWYEPRLFALAADRIEGARVGEATSTWYREMVGEENRDGWEATLEHVRSMRDAVEARGGVFVVVLWPLLVRLDDYPFRDTHQTIVEGFGSVGVEVHDTLPAFAGLDEASLWVHPADRHPNRRAQEIFAEAVGPVLRSALEAAP